MGRIRKFNENWFGSREGVINNLSDYEGDDWDLKVLEFDKVDQKFADFVRSGGHDYALRLHY